MECIFIFYLEKLSPSEEKPSGALTNQTSSAVNDKISAQVAAESKSKVSSIAIGSRSNTGSPLTSPTSPLPPVVMATTEPSATVSAPTISAPTVSAVSPTTVSAPTPVSVVLPTASVPSPAPVETTTPVSPTTRFPPQTDSASDFSTQSLAVSSSSNQHVANAELVATPTVPEKKTEENLSLSEKGDKTIFMDTHISAKRLSQSQKGATESKIDSDIKSRMSHFQIPDVMSSKPDATNSSSIDSLHMKVANPELASVTVPKEDYKVKHQIRSKTLPAVIGEQSSATVQRSSSHRIPNSGAGLKELQDDSAVLSDENIILSSSVLTSSSLPDAKKPENIKVSSTESKVMSAGEPSWMNMVRRKKSEPETNTEIEKIKPNESAIARSGASTAAPKSIFTSANYLEKKRGSTETISFRNRDLPDVTVKKTDSSDPKRQSLDLTSLNKAMSTELSSSKKETVEKDLCNVGSVKASRSIFDSSSKPVSQRDNVLPTSSAVSTHNERIRKFSSSSVLSGSSSVKASSNTNQELPVVAAVASEVKSTVANEVKSTVASEVKSTVASDVRSAVASEVKPTVASGGVTHSRGSSVKTSMSKTYEVKPSIYKRTGSVKGPTLSATSSSPSASTASASTASAPTASAPTASAPVKAEAVSASKADRLEAAAAAPSSQPSAQHAPAHVTAPPNPSLPSQTSSVTPLAFFVQPFNAYSSKPLANIALASRPAFAATQIYSKPACTPTNTTAQTHPASEPALVAASSKCVSVPNVKLLTSTSTAANSFFALPNVSSSSTNSTNLTTSSSIHPPSSSLLMPHTSSTRAQPFITTSAAFKPHSSNTSHFNPTSTSSIQKSPSFKTAATSSEKVVPFQKVAASEKPAADVKKPVTPAKVPAWRTHLSSKDVKIEIIENSPTPTPASSSQTSSENLRKPNDKAKLQEAPKVFGFTLVVVAFCSVNVNSLELNVCFLQTQ